MKEVILAIVVSVFASTGFWAFITAWYQSITKKYSASDKLLMGIGYSKICELTTGFIQRGNISKDEYEELRKYLYDPYREMGGNGTCEKLMKEVEKLPIKD